MLRGWGSYDQHYKMIPTELTVNHFLIRSKMDSFISESNDLTSKMPTVTPPPVKKCKECFHNAADDKTGLCASCDLNHPFWK